MNRRILVAASAVTIAIVAIALAFIVLSRTGVSTVISATPNEPSAAVGNDFSIDIRISDAVQLYGWELKLAWNTTILDLVNTTEGEFLKNDGNTLFNATMENTTGYLYLYCTLIGNVQGANGNGNLATVAFHIREPGYSSLDLYDSKLLNTLEKLIPHQTHDGYVNAH